MQALSDEQLRAKTAEFKARVAKGEALDAILPEAFAVRGAVAPWAAGSWGQGRASKRNGDSALMGADALPGCRGAPGLHRFYEK